MFCTICAERAGPGVGRIGLAGLIALAAVFASGSDVYAQQQDSILKQGFKLFGFATDVAAPPDFVTKTRPDVDPDYKGNGLQLQFTVEDEGVFTTPWSATITYRRGINSQGTDKLQEIVCAENPNLYYAGRDAGLPTATKPDF